MYNIVFSPEAVEDLKETKRYIAEELCSEQAATKTVSQIMKNLRMLSAHPQMGPSLSTVVDLDTDYRFLVCGKYIAFYKFGQREIRIIRVLYARRNYMQMLFGKG